MVVARDGYKVIKGVWFRFVLLTDVGSCSQIRTATDLNLHRKTTMTGIDTPEGRARDKEVHNRERTWLMCFILDRSLSAQMGKPTSIREE